MIEIITVGDELVSGGVIDTNSAYIARDLHSLGFVVSKITTVGDGLHDIECVLKSPMDDSRIIIITGGLGPTQDDKTAQAAAQAFGKELRLDPQACAFIEDVYKKYGKKPTPAARKQAMLPEECAIIHNPVGTACGFLIKDGERHFVFLPGVPEEVRAMTTSFLIPFIENETGSEQIILEKTLKVFGLPESVIQERLNGVLPESSTVSLGFYPDFPEIRLKIIGKGSDRDRLQRDMKVFQDAICENIGEYVYSESDESLEEVVGKLLTEQNATLSVAESCTGGLITHRLTNISGSSRYVERTVVVYSNKAKEELLNVPFNLIERFGAVSEPVARSMAQGVRLLAGTTYGLAVTGIAGPTGGSPGKPVGTVFTGISTETETRVIHNRFYGTRERVKMMSAQTCLSLLKDTIQPD